MAIIRSIWRKATWFSCFLLAVGFVEYVLLVQLHSSLLSVAHETGDETLLPGKTVTSRGEAEERAELQWAGVHFGLHDPRDFAEERERRELAGGGDAGEYGGFGDPSEVRLARELHDLRMDRLSQFRRPERGPEINVDQQKRSLQQPPTRDKLNDTNLQQLLELLEERFRTGQMDLALNLTLLLSDGGSPLGRSDVLKHFLSESRGSTLGEALDRLHDAYTAQGDKDWKYGSISKQGADKESDDDDSDDDEEEKEEEEENGRVFDPNDFLITMNSDGTVNVTRKELEPEVLVENSTFPLRNMTTSEKEGLNIMLTIRTTVSNHRKRLPLLFETWLTKVNTSQVFLVTDGDDTFTRLWTTVKGIHYVDVKCGDSYSREQLCCKAGMELGLMFEKENKPYDWICHVDDDMYVNMRNLVELLSVFDPRKDPIYLGRSGSPWNRPRRVKKKAKLSKPGTKYHFAVGGMYCLSRAMLVKTRKWIVGGEALSKSCSLTREPEDVTVGLVAAMQNYSLSRTERINTHGLHLATTVDPYTLHSQVAISYGYGSVHWGEDPYNAVYIPDAVFTLEEDESQFRSLHCLLYPTTSWCVRQSQLYKFRREQQLQAFSNYPDIF